MDGSVKGAFLSTSGRTVRIGGTYDSSGMGFQPIEEIRDLLNEQRVEDRLASRTLGDTTMAGVKLSDGSPAYRYGARSFYWPVADKGVFTDDRPSQTGGPGGPRGVPEARDC